MDNDYKFTNESNEARVVHYEVQRTYNNAETGEIVSDESTVVSRQPSTPDFTMVFSRDLGYLKNITSGASKLLFGLIQIVDRNNELTLNKARKKQIAQNTGLKESGIDVLLKQLKDKDVIISLDRGIYQLNPYLFGKGSWKNIRKMRMTLEYDFNKNTKSISVETEHLDDGDGFDMEANFKQIVMQEQQ